MCASIRSHGIAETESGKPREKAKPADVVATALKPTCCKYLAVPTSHGFGRTKQPDACKARNSSMVDDWLMPRSYNGECNRARPGPVGYRSLKCRPRLYR